MHIYIYLQLNICIYTYIYVYKHKYIHTYIHIYIHIHICICMYIYEYIYIHIYIHICTYTYICLLTSQCCVPCCMTIAQAARTEIHHAYRHYVTHKSGIFPAMTSLLSSPLLSSPLCSYILCIIKWLHEYNIDVQACMCACIRAHISIDRIIPSSGVFFVRLEKVIYEITSDHQNKSLIFFLVSWGVLLLCAHSVSYIHTCTHAHVSQYLRMTHLYVQHYSFTCETWFIQICDMIHQ